MAAGEKAFSLKITDNAKAAYFELLDYLFQYYSLSRANELAEALLNAPLVLLEQPYLGSREPSLLHRTIDYRFLLFQRSNRATVKIVYYIDDSHKIIYITDFFPTEMHPEKAGRKR